MAGKSYKAFMNSSIPDCLRCFRTVCAKSVQQGSSCMPAI